MTGKTHRTDVAIKLSGSYSLDNEIYSDIVRIKPYEEEHSDKSITYICPICRSMGYLHYVYDGMFRCNGCGVYLDWDKE